MFLLFEPYIKRILDDLKPKTILEIGVLNGGNTVRLLEWCSKNPGSKLISIDPASWSGELPEAIAKSHPQFSCPGAPFPAPYLEDAYKRGLFSTWTCLKDYSLSAIPSIQQSIDLAIVDGDHNYYTVSNELRLLENKMSPNGVTLFHDVVGLWARQDSYYDISKIPLEYRHSRTQGVMTAIDEYLKLKGGKKVGIFTGIESFVAKYNSAPCHFDSLKAKVLGAARNIVKGRNRISVGKTMWDEIDQEMRVGDQGISFEILSTRDHGLGILRRFKKNTLS